jgi:hypothetical protein
MSSNQIPYCQIQSKNRNFVANSIKDNSLATLSQLCPELVTHMVDSNFTDTVIPNDSRSDEEHRAICIKLMRRTENESPDKVVWFSLTLSDIILRAIMLPNLLSNSFLRQLPTDHFTHVSTNSSELGCHSWRQPGLSTCVISDKELIYS